MQLVNLTDRCRSNTSAVPYLAHISPSQIPLLAASPSSFSTLLIENRLSHRHLKSCPVLRTGPQGPRSYSRHSNLGSLDHGELARQIAAALTQGEKLTSADVATVRAKHNTDFNWLGLRTGCNDMFRRRRDDSHICWRTPSPPAPAAEVSTSAPPATPPPAPAGIAACVLVLADLDCKLPTFDGHSIDHVQRLIARLLLDKINKSVALEEWRVRRQKMRSSAGEKDRCVLQFAGESR